MDWKYNLWPNYQTWSNIVLPVRPVATRLDKELPGCMRLEGPVSCLPAFTTWSHSKSVESSLLLKLYFCYFEF
jgi:hypothetical protein